MNSGSKADCARSGPMDMCAFPAPQPRPPVGGAVRRPCGPCGPACKKYAPDHASLPVLIVARLRGGAQRRTAPSTCNKQFRCLGAIEHRGGGVAEKQRVTGPPVRAQHDEVVAALGFADDRLVGRRIGTDAAAYVEAVTLGQ